MLAAEEWAAVGLSARVALFAVLLSAPAAVACGWTLARRSGRGVLWLRLAAMSPLVLPPVVTGYLLLGALGRRSPLGGIYEAWVGTPIAYSETAAVLVAAIVGFPLFVEAARIAFAGVDPRLEAMSRSLGRGRFDTFLRITLPGSAAGIASGAVLAFARGLGEFGATIVFAGNVEGETRTIPLAVYTAMHQVEDGGATLRLVAASLVLAALALLVSGALGLRRASGGRPG